MSSEFESDEDIPNKRRALYVQKLTNETSLKNPELTEKDI